VQESEPVSEPEPVKEPESVSEPEPEAPMEPVAEDALTESAEAVSDEVKEEKGMLISRSILRTGSIPFRRPETSLSRERWIPFGIGVGKGSIVGLYRC